MGSALQREPALALDLLIFFRGCRAQETVRGRSGGLRRTVGAMDGAIEPPWVRALCLRSTASQGPNAQPPAAGPVWGFTACPAQPPDRPNSQCRST